MNTTDSSELVPLLDSVSEVDLDDLPGSETTPLDPSEAVAMLEELIASSSGSGDRIQSRPPEDESSGLRAITALEAYQRLERMFAA